MTSRDRAWTHARVGQVVTALGLAGLIGIIIRAVAFTPVERIQGPAQKIFYMHVPAAWNALMAFMVTGLLSIGYLWLKDVRLDRAAAASAEVGVAFACVMMTTGPIWGKPVWGVWWAWEARLTSTLFVTLLFVGYLLLRGSVQDREMRSRFSAVLGILGMVLVPFVHLTVYLFRTQHPEPVILKPEGPTLPQAMLVTLLASVGVFTVLYLGMVIQRYALSTLSDAREEELQHAT